MRSRVAATTGSVDGGCFLLIIAVVAALFVANVDASDKSAVVVGVVRCSKCTQNQQNAGYEVSPYQGVLVGIQCKTSKGEVHESGVARIDDNGSYKMNLPQYIVNDKGELAAECHAKLLTSYSLQPCSTNGDGDMSTKLELQAKSKESDSDVETMVFGTSTDLSLSSSTCPSAFSVPLSPLTNLPLKPLLKPLPPLPKIPPKPILKPKPLPKPKLKPLPPLPKLPPKPKLKPIPKPHPKPILKPKPLPKPKLKPLPPLPKKPLPPQLTKLPLKPLPPIVKIPPKIKPVPKLKPPIPFPKITHPPVPAFPPFSVSPPFPY